MTKAYDMTGRTAMAASALAMAAVLLAAEPLAWLVQTWLDPSYASIGGAVTGLVLILACWSWSGPGAALPLTHDDEGNGDAERAVLLLCATALVRLIGRLIAVRMLGAFALVFDVYALTVLTGLHRRQRALAPGWLAFAFAFALPVERVAQRVLGYGLQQASARGACAMLDWGIGGVVCAGTRIAVAGKDVMVDLPCSGARGLVQLLVLFALLAAAKRPTAASGAAGIAIALASALAANAIRIALLALGLVHPEWIGGADVMTPPWHEAIGIFCLATGVLPLLFWARAATRKAPHIFALPRIRALPALTSRPLPALAFLATAALITSVPGRPLDVQVVAAAPVLPQYLAGSYAVPRTLTERESEYFTQFGGSAVKASYGDQTLLLIRTTSPLRHLHAPDECLQGAGHMVELLGVRYGTMPAAIYRSVAPDGRAYRVAVTFVADDGRMATSVAEVAWRWLEKPRIAWTAVQRVTEWNDLGGDAARFDAAVARALIN